MLDSVVGNIVLFWFIDVSSLVTSAEMSILDKSPNLSTISFELISGGDKKELKKVVTAKQILLQFPNQLTDIVLRFIVTICMTKKCCSDTSNGVLNDTLAQLNKQ